MVTDNQGMQALDFDLFGSCREIPIGAGEGKLHSRPFSSALGGKL